MDSKTTLRRADLLIKGFTIPSHPAVLLEVRRTLNRFAPDLRRVMTIIVADMALSSRVLRIANSHLRGHKRSVESIGQAAALLGMETLRGIVQELFLSVGLTSRDSALQEVRRRGLSIARLTAWLAGEVPRLNTDRKTPLPIIPADSAYAAGLFHDCGQLVMLQKFAGYAALYDDWQQNGREPLVAIEHQRHELDHALLGSRMARARSFPDSLVRLIREHHQVEGFTEPGTSEAGLRYATLHALLYLAQYFGDELTVPEWQAAREPLSAFFGLAPAGLEGLRDPALAAINARSGKGLP